MHKKYTWLHGGNLMKEKNSTSITSFLNPDEDFDRKKNKTFSWPQYLTCPDYPSSCSESWWRRRHRYRRFYQWPSLTSSCYHHSFRPLASTGREWESSSFWKVKEDLRHHRHRRLCLFWSFWNLVCQGLSFLSFLLPRHRPHPRSPILLCPPPSSPSRCPALCKKASAASTLGCPLNLALPHPSSRAL